MRPGPDGGGCSTVLPMETERLWIRECVVAVCDPRNAASIKVTNRLGMRFERETTGRDLGLRVPDVELVYYSLSNPRRDPGATQP